MRVSRHSEPCQVLKRADRARIIELPSDIETPKSGDNLYIDELRRVEIRIPGQSRTGSITP